MSAWEIIRHAVAIFGTVTDSRTGKTLKGARVQITSGPAAFTSWLALKAMEGRTRWEFLKERPDRRCTAQDGHFHFMDLPDGQYTLTASMPDMGTRYGIVQTQLTVARDAQSHIIMATVDMALPSTAVTGLVTTQGGAPLPMALVQVMGSGERAYTNGDGSFLLRGLEAGSRMVTASAQGYEHKSLTVNLAQAGVVQTADFVLLPGTP